MLKAPIAHCRVGAPLPPAMRTTAPGAAYGAGGGGGYASEDGAPGAGK